MQRTSNGLCRLYYNAAWRSPLATTLLALTAQRHGNHIISSVLAASSIVSRASVRILHGASSKLSEEELLWRSWRFNIRSIKELDHESNFDVPQVQGHPLLADNFPPRVDLELWHLLLDYRMQRYGSKGASTIYKGLQYRGPAVSLESEDARTTSLWYKLLSCAAEHNDMKLAMQLCDPDGIARQRSQFFVEAISTFLRCGRNFKVKVMINWLKSNYANDIADVLEVYEAFQPQNLEDIRKFCYIYDRLPPRKMYRHSVLPLLHQGRHEEAVVLHKFLVSNDDCPATFQDVVPMIQYLAEMNEDPGPFLRRLAASGVVFAGQSSLLYENETRMNAQNLNRTHDPKVLSPNKVSDGFAAKAFATKALSFEFTLNALRAFGLTEVGPQCLREIGLAAFDIEDFSKRLELLDEFGIDTGGSAYSRFIRKTCLAQESYLLFQGLRTDMHHDVFEDVHLQLRLLVNAIDKCAWPKVDLLLAMLNHAQVDQLDARVVSFFLEAVVNDDRKARTFLTLLSTLKDTNVRFSAVLFRDLIDRMLLRLRLGQEKDDLFQTEYRRRAQFTAGVLQECIIAGTEPTSTQWKQLLWHLGRSGAFQHAQNMAVWLALWHLREAKIATSQDKALKAITILNETFDCRTQTCLVHWALRDQFYKMSGSIRHSWRTTLMLLRFLQTDCNVSVPLNFIRRRIVFFVQSLHRRSMPSRNSRAADSRIVDSRRLCFKLLRSLHEFWPRSPNAASSDRQVALANLSSQKNAKANEVMMKARPTPKKALRRFPDAHEVARRSSRIEKSLE